MRRAALLARQRVGDTRRDRIAPHEVIDACALLLEIGERPLSHEIAPGNAVVPLYRGEPQPVPGLAERRGLHEPRARGAAQRICIEADIDPEANRPPSARPACAVAAVADDEEPPDWASRATAFWTSLTARV